MKRQYWGNSQPEAESESMLVPQRLLVNLKETFAETRPFVFASFTAWPMFWLFRGLDWGITRRRPFDRNLITYINRTYYQAKMLQIGIISLGFLAASYNRDAVLQFFDPYSGNRPEESKSPVSIHQQRTLQQKKGQKYDKF